MPTPIFRSTDEIESAKFRPHGRVTFSREGNILIRDAIGPFNKELIDAAAVVEAEILPEFVAMGRWGEVVVFHESVLASLDVLEAFSERLASLASQAYTANASALVVARDVEGAEFMVPRLKQAYIDNNWPMTVFESLPEAMKWVRVQIGDG